eukprot:743287-Ditylum_brightwellii.AAC.1
MKEKEMEETIRLMKEKLTSEHTEEKEEMIKALEMKDKEMEEMAKTLEIKEKEIGEMSRVNLEEEKTTIVEEYMKKIELSEGEKETHEASVNMAERDAMVSKEIISQLKE